MASDLGLACSSLNCKMDALSPTIDSSAFPFPPSQIKLWGGQKCGSTDVNTTSPDLTPQRKVWG